MNFEVEKNDENTLAYSYYSPSQNPNAQNLF
jgi:hypothetical protein